MILTDIRSYVPASDHLLDVPVQVGWCRRATCWHDACSNVRRWHILGQTPLQMHRASSGQMRRTCTKLLPWAEAQADVVARHSNGQISAWISLKSIIGATPPELMVAYSLPGGPLSTHPYAWRKLHALGLMHGPSHEGSILRLLRPWAPRLYLPMTSEMRQVIQKRGEGKEMVKKTIGKVSNRAQVTPGSVVLVIIWHWNT